MPKTEIIMFNYELDQNIESIEKSASKNSKKYLPLLDVYDNGENFIVSVELPGVRKEDIKVKLDDEELVISAFRNRDENFNVIHPERYFGEIERKVKFHSEIDEDNIKAVFENGVLSVWLRKLNKRKEIKIN